jgi:hypothetical protein
LHWAYEGKNTMSKRWTADKIVEMMRGYQGAGVAGAAAQLGIFECLAEKPLTAGIVVERLGTDLRATTILLDALAAMELVVKIEGRYKLEERLAGMLCDGRAGNIAAILRHTHNCLRRWSRLDHVVKDGQPGQRDYSIRGEQGDEESFIAAMHALSEPNVDEVLGRLGELRFSHLLDIGGASGTWTIGFLRLAPRAQATLFDLPDVIPQAESRLGEAGLSARVNLVAGDFYTDPLPKGADFAWLSAIAHQNSRQQNLELFGRIHEAIQPGGILAIRDIVMKPCHTLPKGGAMFAVNMLTATPGGGTYSFEEYRDDLIQSGFSQADLVYQDEWMNSLILAHK